MNPLTKALLVSALLGSGSALAAAYPEPNTIRVSPPIPSASALTETAAALAPLAFVQFCISYRDQCAASEPVAALTLDAEIWENLHRVNREVNDAITPDEAKGGYDWSLETRLGNCNDYAIQKRSALIRLGYPAAALSLAVVKTAFGEGHLVVTVRTDRGDFVLDNRRNTIVAWNRTGYRWIKRQSVENPQHWVALVEKPDLRRVQPAAPAPAMASSPPSESRNAIATAGATDTAEGSKWSTAIPLPSIGFAARRLDLIMPAQSPERPYAIGATISHAAAGRQLAMLAFDEIGRWSL